MIKHIPLRLREFGGGVFYAKMGMGIAKSAEKE